MFKKLSIIWSVTLLNLLLPMTIFGQNAEEHYFSDEEIKAMEEANIDVESESEKHVNSDADKAMEQLMSEWEGNGYPDNVGHVMMDNDGEIIIGLVDNSESAQADIKEMIDEPDQLNFESARYSYNDLLATHEEIAKMMNEQVDDSRDIYGVGTGLATIDGEVTGFGDSGHEFRVVVSVAEDAYDKYVETFNETYGDRVYVESTSEPPTDDVESFEDDEVNEGSETNTEENIDHEVSENNDIASESNEDRDESALPATPGNSGNTSDQIQNGIWFSLIGLALLACIVLTIYLIRHNRFTAAKQTTTGDNITDTTPVQRAEIISAIKKSNMKPSDRVDQRMMEMIKTKSNSEKKDAHISKKDNI